MKNTEQTLLEQMRVTDFEIANRKELFSITEEDESVLKNTRSLIDSQLEKVVTQFYEMQTGIPEIALLIGDSDTLGRLRNAQSTYIRDLFSGYYDIEYVNNRLRIGMVHKRIGVEPKLYLVAVQTLRELLLELISEAIPDPKEQSKVNSALQKLIMFDVSLIFDTYIRSLVSEIEISKDKSDQYAKALEEKVKERTLQLETLSRTDPLTGLLSTRYLDETLTRVLRAAERRNEPVTLVYIDVNEFKQVNDTKGHQQGDELLKRLARAITDASRIEDFCFRYGGDEFCTIMPNCQLEVARSTWEKRLMEQLTKYSDMPTLSIGYAQSGPYDYMSTEELIRQADEEMYIMKKTQKQAELIDKISTK